MSLNNIEDEIKDVFLTRNLKCEVIPKIKHVNHYEIDSLVKLQTEGWLLTIGITYRNGTLYDYTYGLSQTPTTNPKSNAGMAEYERDSIVEDMKSTRSVIKKHFDSI